MKKLLLLFLMSVSSLIYSADKNESSIKVIPLDEAASLHNSLQDLYIMSFLPQVKDYVFSHHEFLKLIPAFILPAILENFVVENIRLSLMSEWQSKLKTTRDDLKQNRITYAGAILAKDANNNIAGFVLIKNQSLRTFLNDNLVSITDKCFREIASAFRDNQIYVDVLAVDPSYQRQGYGRKLMLSILDIFHDANEIYLRTEISNESAQKFYESLGFKKVLTGIFKSNNTEDGDWSKQERVIYFAQAKILGNSKRKV